MEAVDQRRMDVDKTAVPQANKERLKAEGMNYF